MKHVMLTVILFSVLSVFAQEQVELKSGTSLELNYEDFETSTVEIKNKSLKTFAVHVEDSSSKEWVKGFGLGPKGKEIIDVRSDQMLVLKNESNTDINVELRFIERKTLKKAVNSNQMITFTLHNSTSKSIPLVIPNVMNPNLSPFSDSGVKLKVGQKIYYRSKGKKRLLLTVNNTIEEGAKINVAEYIKELERK